MAQRIADMACNFYEDLQNLVPDLDSSNPLKAELEDLTKEAQPSLADIKQKVREL